MKDYYQILQVPPGASLDEVKNAYRRLAMLYHPDRNPSARAARLFQEVQEAFDTLTDEDLRKAFEAWWRQPRPPDPPDLAPPGWEDEPPLPRPSHGPSHYGGPVDGPRYGGDKYTHIKYGGEEYEYSDAIKRFDEKLQQVGLWLGVAALVALFIFAFYLFEEASPAVQAVLWLLGGFAAWWLLASYEKFKKRK